MIFEALNENMMLIELSYEEMENHSITYEALKNDEKSVKSAIKSIIEKSYARDRLKKGETVIVEALPESDGGCFFILTFVKKKIKYRVKKDNFYVFETEKFDNILDFIIVAKKEKVKNIKCDAYKMDGRYFLSIPQNFKKLASLMSEYAKPSKLDINKLSEYAENMGTVYLQ